MEDAVWLPGLPPQRLESDAGVVDDEELVERPRVLQGGMEP